MIDLFFRSLSDLMSQELQELFHGGHSQNSTDGNQQATSLHLPSIFTYLPHLTGHSESLKPKYYLSKNRYGGKTLFEQVNFSFILRTI